MGIVDVQQGQGNLEYNSPMEGRIVFTSVFPIHPLENPELFDQLPGFRFSEMNSNQPRIAPEFD